MIGLFERATNFNQSWCSEVWAKSVYISQSSDFDFPTGAGLVCCMSGYYKSLTKCSECHAGMFQNKSYTQTSSCMKCPRNKFAAGTASAKCFDCQVGRFSKTLTHATECIACASGKVQVDTANSSYCLDCTVGHYQPNEGETSCYRCSEGNYQDEKAKQYCFP